MTASIFALPAAFSQGTHGSRPAASSVAVGAIYACSTHSLLYQSDGSSWSTWFNGAGTGFANPMTTAEDIIYGGASGTPTRKAKGSDGTFLGVTAGAIGYTAVTDALLSTSDITTNNASTTKHGFAPKYPNDATKYLDGTGAYTVPAGGGGGSGALVFLETHTGNNTSQNLDFTTFISSTYDTYKIIGTDIALATNTANLLLEVGTGGGPTYDTGSNYEYGFTGIDTNGTAKTSNASPAAAIKIFNSMSNNAGYGFGDFELIANELQSTAHRKTFYGNAHWVDTAPSSIFYAGGGQWTTLATAVTALRFTTSSGNIASGTIRIYGISKS